MHITIEHHAGTYPSFNINLHSTPTAEAFISIKGCRLVNGQNGQFVSYPSRKQDNGKYWNHVWGSEKFNAVVLQKALEGQPAPEPRQAPPPQRQQAAPAGSGGNGFEDFDNQDIPF